MPDETSVNWEAMVDRLRAEKAELKHYCERLKDENSKLGLQYDLLLKEKSDLDRKLGFLEGQVEAFRYVLNCKRRDNS